MIKVEQMKAVTKEGTVIRKTEARRLFFLSALGEYYRVPNEIKYMYHTGDCAH